MLDKILAGMSLMDEAPNGVRCPLVGFDRLNHQVGREDAILPEPTSSHTNCPKTRTAKRPSATAPTHFVGNRMHVGLSLQRLRAAGLC